jgi:hypothetical protein
MPILEEGEVRMSEQVLSTNGETQIFDVNLRNVRNWLSISRIPIPLWNWWHQRHRHGTGFAGPIQRLLLFACSWSPSVAWQDEINPMSYSRTDLRINIYEVRNRIRVRLGRSHDIFGVEA